jgi:NAD(P)-dependent dehydrogenase (short-subunit alcohol dehydrogenase family)
MPLVRKDRRVWLITGSTFGFGRALVQAARRAGDQVVATARRVDALADLASDDVMTLAPDVIRPETFEPALDDATARFGRIDVLVNNAGIGFVGALEETSLADPRRVMETMFFGPAALTRAIIPRMRQQRSGAIVQISSQGGQITARGFSAYCAAKFALEGLSEAVAAEVAPFGIRVLIVEPGSFRTELLGRSLAAAAVMEEYAPTVGATRATLNAKTAARRVIRRKPPRRSSRRSMPTTHRSAWRLGLTPSRRFAPSTGGSAPNSIAGKRCRAEPHSMP